MSQLDSVIDRLYTSYLLRDFVAKVVPGFVVLSALALSSGTRDHMLRAVHGLSIWAWFLLTGLSFSVGFLVQATGELIGWTHIYPDGSSHNREARANAIRRMIAPSRSNQPAISQQRERYVVLKEMSANFSLSLIIAVAILVSAQLPPPVPGITRLVLLLLALASFFWYGRMQVDDQRTLEEAAIAPQPEAGPPAERRRGRKRAGA